MSRLYLKNLEIGLRIVGESSEHITKEMLIEAQGKWRRRARESARMGVRGKTLLAAARSNPASFNEYEIFLALYDDNLTPEARKAVKQLGLSGKNRRMQDGTLVSFKGATLYENWNIPAGVWLIDCSLINPKKPRVWGIYQVPTPIAPIELPETEAIIAFKQPGVSVLGRLLKLPPSERHLIERHMKAFFKAAPSNQLLHISRAARMINQASPD